MVATERLHKVLQVKQVVLLSVSLPPALPFQTRQVLTLLVEAAEEVVHTALMDSGQAAGAVLVGVQVVPLRYTRHQGQQVGLLVKKVLTVLVKLTQAVVLEVHPHMTTKPLVEALMVQQRVAVAVSFLVSAAHLRGVDYLPTETAVLPMVLVRMVQYQVTETVAAAAAAGVQQAALKVHVLEAQVVQLLQAHLFP